MSKNLCLVLLAVSSVLSATQSWAIVGGQIITDPSAFPTIPLVTLKNPKSKHVKMTVCTSTIITQNIVITTPSCIQDPSNAMVIETTELDGKNFNNLAKIGVKRTLLLSVPAQPGISYHEIVLVQLASDLPSVYRPVDVISTDQADAAPSEILIAGFGSASAHKDIASESKQLRAVAIQNPFANAQAMSIPTLALDSPNAGASFGDAGGPAIVRVGGKDVIWGIDVAKGEDKKSMRSLILGLFQFYPQITQALSDFQK